VDGPLNKTSIDFSLACGSSTFYLSLEELYSDAQSSIPLPQPQGGIISYSHPINPA
jgi:hypothetical protein